MDGSSGYNQIRMAPEDEDLTAFRTPKGVYCYNVMPFGLKNARATYQRAMQKVFDDILHKNVEFYVDDLMVKSRKRADHPQDLRMMGSRSSRQRSILSHHYESRIIYTRVGEVGIPASFHFELDRKMSTFQQVNEEGYSFPVGCRMFHNIQESQRIFNEPSSAGCTHSREAPYTICGSTRVVCGSIIGTRE
ncbi:hypothetical protein LIER_08956 [Lithospermum erythrorhizon]|uniref:Reverse transcriptase domain-containing protein n=1 Tax=Lithospermum erythrorhizon TaxID=34254 RepID=A0AAV3PG43_LITER